MKRDSFRIEVRTITTGAKGDIGVFMLYRVTNSVFYGSGACKLEVWVGSGNFDAVKCFGYRVCAYKVCFVLVGER